MNARAIGWIFWPAAFLTLAAAPPDRGAPPMPGPPPEFRPPEIHHTSLRSGLQIYVVEMHEVPVVAADLWVRSGGLSDPEGLPGLASLTADMLDEGAGKRNALEIADEIEHLGASLDTDAGWDATSISLYVPVERLDAALDIMADVALRPTFPQAELDRLRTERLTTLLQWRDEPRSLSTVAFRQRIYGPDARTGIPALGTEASVRAMTRDDLARFHDSHFLPNNAAIVVAGDVQTAAIVQSIARAFGSWSRGSEPEFPKVPSVTPSATSITLVDRPGSAQTEIRIGTAGPPRNTGDYFALTVLNTVLGGSFSSRLMQNIREEHGYSYGAGSRFEMNRNSGLFYALSAVQTAVTDSALYQFMKELRDIHREVSENEISRAKNNLTLSFPGDFETTQQTVDRVAQIYLYDLPEDYFASYIDSVKAVTAVRLQRVADRYLDSSKMEIVLVGDREQIEAKVQQLGVGEVRVMTVEDLLGKPPKV